MTSIKMLENPQKLKMPTDLQLQIAIKYSSYVWQEDKL